MSVNHSGPKRLELGVRSWCRRMLLIGDISGIQSYLFDVSNRGGGQARRMRARSLYIQLVAECALLRILDACGWDESAVVFCGAGKFILSRDCPVASVEARVREEAVAISRNLLKELGGRLRFSVAMRDTTGTILDAYDGAQRDLQFEKASAWRDIAGQSGQWDEAVFRLAPLDTPCGICARLTVSNENPLRVGYKEDRGGLIDVCQRCFDDFQIGRRLPKRPNLFIGNSSVDAGSSFEILNRWVTLRENHQLPPATRKINRPLARHIPTTPDSDGFDKPLDFTSIAGASRGDTVLGVLKADADGLGKVFTGLLSNATDLSPLKQLSGRLDFFFASELDKELKQHAYENIYTIFAGGDDLLLVGPWNVILDYAGHMQRLFTDRFRQEKLTISAGIGMIAPKRPIKFAVQNAERLLERAKHQDGKNSVAVLGQVFNWVEFEFVLSEGKKVAGWIDQDVMPRGWAHTLLGFALARDVGTTADRYLVTAKLAYHIARNYPAVFDERRKGRPPHAREKEETNLRRWADKLLDDFDDRTQNLSKFLPAITRYALMATRKKERE